MVKYDVIVFFKFIFFFHNEPSSVCARNSRSSISHTAVYLMAEKTHIETNDFNCITSRRRNTRKHLQILLENCSIASRKSNLNLTSINPCILMTTCSSHTNIYNEYNILYNVLTPTEAVWRNSQWMKYNSNWHWIMFFQ